MGEIKGLNGRTSGYQRVKFKVAVDETQNSYSVGSAGIRKRASVHQGAPCIVPRSPSGSQQRNKILPRSIVR